MTAVEVSERHKVTVWVGEVAIAEHLVDVAYASRLEQATCRRYPWLRVTNEPIQREDLK